MSPRRILVIGGTGYAGRRIVERFLALGDDVTVVSRGKLDHPVLRQAHHLQLDRKDYATFEAAFAQAKYDVVIDNIPFDRADVDSVIRAFAGRTEQLILTSSIAVYHDLTPLAQLREHQADLTAVSHPDDQRGSGPHPTLGFAYNTHKRQAELALREAAPSAFRWTILRPPMVMGPDDRTRRVWWHVQRLLDGGPILIPTYGPRHVFQVVSADDLAASYVAVASNPSCFDRAYNICNPELFTPELWVRAVAEALGRDVETASIPAPYLEAAGLPGYEMPIAGRPFGNVLSDTFALRHDTGFSFTPGPEWVGDMARGCAANPPTANSAGYERRQQEIQVVRRVQQLEAQKWAALSSSGT